MYKQKLSLRDTLAKNFINAVGWSTKRHLLLIESDDWGAIRMPSKTIYDKLSKAGFGEGGFFDKYDSLEGWKDMEMLFEVLSCVLDKNGHPAVIQPSAIMANPDYEAIEDNQFTQYVYESFLTTYERHPHTEGTFEYIKQGMAAGVWHPQLHGREHLQVNRWMKCLQSGDKLERMNFDNHAMHLGHKLHNYNPAFDYDSKEELSQIANIIKQSIEIFDKLYGYKPVTLCPPAGFFCDDLVNVASEYGIKLIGGQYRSPKPGGGYKLHNHYWGTSILSNSKFYRRNCKFEPARDHNIDWVDRCMSEIEIAFRWGKPACIDTHRVNYIGSIDPGNRDFTLHELRRLLESIVKQWPNVEFVTSEELYKDML